MNYVKTFFITTILLSTSTIFNSQGPDGNYFAYSTEQSPTTLDDLLVEPIVYSSATNTPVEPEDVVVEETTPLQKWDNHLLSLDKNWKATNNVPEDAWKSTAFTLAENVLEKDKDASTNLKSTFIEAINKQTSTIDIAVLNLIKEFEDLLTAKLSSLESKAAENTKEETVVEPTPAPSEETTQQPESDTNTESPTTPNETSSQTSESTTNTQEQTDAKLLQEWQDVIATMQKPDITKEEADAALDKASIIAEQLKDKKSPLELKEEFEIAFEILRLRKIIHPADLMLKKEIFNRVLFSDVYEQSEQEEQERLAAEQQKMIQAEIQKFRDEAALANEKREKSEKQIQAALALAKDQQKISEDKARELELRTKAYAQQLAEKSTSLLNSSITAKERSAREALAKNIEQQSAAAKKLAAQQKEAANRGVLGNIVKKVSDIASSLWYGTDDATSHALTPEEEQQELNAVKTLLANTDTKTKSEKKTITKLWQDLQKTLRTAPQSLDGNSLVTDKKWIASVEKIMKELVFTHQLLTIEQACLRIKKSLPFPLSADQDYRAEIINKIKNSLENTKAWQDSKRKHEEENKQQKIQARKSRKEQITLKQQRIKNEELRKETEKKKQLMAVAQYKKERQEWKIFLDKISHDQQASGEDNNAQLLEALKKSESLLKLARVIPSKNRNDVSQKLKSEFTRALLDQQKINPNNINIHHIMDQFNLGINKLLE